MKLYKFRSLATQEDFDRAKEIIETGLFYCSKFTELNDPMEGMFEYMTDIPVSKINQITGDKQELRICSFTKNYCNILLWAYYADGFKGICIEIEIDRNACPYKIDQIRYRKDRFQLTNENTENIDDKAKEILSIKNVAWRHEKEVRIFSNDKYIDKGFEIKGLFFGMRIEQEHKRAIKELIGNSIPIYDTKISNKSNKVVREIIGCGSL